MRAISTLKNLLMALVVLIASTPAMSQLINTSTASKSPICGSWPIGEGETRGFRQRYTLVFDCNMNGGKAIYESRQLSSNDQTDPLERVWINGNTVRYFHANARAEVDVELIYSINAAGEETLSGGGSVFFPSRRDRREFNVVVRRPHAAR